MKKLNVALVGLSFGLEFVAIYCKHPDVNKVFIVDKNEKLLTIARNRYNIPAEQCFTDFEEILKIPEYFISFSIFSGNRAIRSVNLK